MNRHGRNTCGERNHPYAGLRILTGHGVAALALAGALSGWDASGMSAAQHLNGHQDFGGAMDLMGTPASKGGSGKLQAYLIERLNKWMDNPATRTGEYTNRRANAPISPMNHNDLRHNPLAVAKVFSGTGKADPAALNVARLHKIQDVANNTRPVDGWEISDPMRRDAQGILQKVKSGGRLPEKLPQWVDDSGPLLTANRSTALPTAAMGTAKGVGKAVRIAGKVALPAAILCEAGLALWEANEIEERFARGEIGETERRQAHVVNTAKAGAGLAVIGAGAAVGILVTPAGPVLLVTVGGTLAVAYAAEWAAEHAAAWYNEWQERVAAENLRMDKERLAAVGVFDIHPDTLKAAGATGDRLRAYTEAYEAAERAGKVPQASLITIESAFDENLFFLEKEADFHAELAL